MRVLGKSGPVLAAFAAAAIPLALKGPSGRAASIAGFGEKAYNNAFTSNSRFTSQNGFLSAPGIGYQQQQAQQARGYSESLAGGLFSPGYGASSIYALLGAGLPALSNLQQGETGKATANLGGGAIGAAIGGALGGPVGLSAGATIGSAIAEAFVSGVEVRSEDFTKLFEPPTEYGVRGRGGEPETPTDQKQQLEQVYRSIGGNSSVLGIVRAGLSELISQSQTLADVTQGPGAIRYETKQSAALSILQKQNPVLYSQLQLQNPNREATNKSCTRSQDKQANSRIKRIVKYSERAATN